MTFPEFCDALANIDKVHRHLSPKTSKEIVSEMAREQIEEENELKRRRSPQDEQ